jgi:hypothetical protein
MSASGVSGSPYTARPRVARAGRADPHHRREAFVGIDVAKLKNAVAVADGGRNGEIRYFGDESGGAKLVHGSGGMVPLRAA